MRLHYSYMNQATPQAVAFRPRFERGGGSENFTDVDLTVHFGWENFGGMKNNSRYTIRAMLGDGRGAEHPPWEITVQVFARLRECYTVTGSACADTPLECLHSDEPDRFPRIDDALSFAAEWILARLHERKTAGSAPEAIEGAA